MINKDKLKNFDKLPADVRRQFSLLANQYGEKKKTAGIQNNFMDFVKHVWPDFIEGKHHQQIADKFDKLASGEIKRLIINMPPRHTKSEFGSYLLPAWMVGRNPKLKIIQSTLLLGIKPGATFLKFFNLSMKGVFCSGFGGGTIVPFWKPGRLMYAIICL